MESPATWLLLSIVPKALQAPTFDVCGIRQSAGLLMNPTRPMSEVSRRSEMFSNIASLARSSVIVLVALSSLPAMAPAASLGPISQQAVPDSASKPILVWNGHRHGGWGHGWRHGGWGRGWGGWGPGFALGFGLGLPLGYYGGYNSYYPGYDGYYSGYYEEPVYRPRVYRRHYGNYYRRPYYRDRYYRRPYYRRNYYYGGGYNDGYDGSTDRLR